MSWPGRPIVPENGPDRLRTAGHQETHLKGGVMNEALRFAREPW